MTTVCYSRQAPSKRWVDPDVAIESALAALATATDAVSRITRHPPIRSRLPMDSLHIATVGGLWSFELRLMREGAAS